MVPVRAEAAVRVRTGAVGYSVLVETVPVRSGMILAHNGMVPVRVETVRF